MTQRKWAAAGLFVGMSILGIAAAAYQPIPNPLPVTPQDILTRPIGGNVPGQPNQPIGVNQSPSLMPTTPVLLFPPGMTPSPITDGQRYASLTSPYKAVTSDKSGLIVGLSPVPSLQCPFVQNVNQTASATVITNPGGMLIHICTDKLISATQQGITLAEGTGTTCATNPTYVDGGSGGTNQVAANGGWGDISDRIITPMQKAGDNWCVIQSSTGNVSGKLTYGLFPQ